MHNYTIYTAHIVYRVKNNQLRAHWNNHIKYFCKQSMTGSEENTYFLEIIRIPHSEEIAFKDTALDVNNVLCIKTGITILQFKKLYIYTNFTHQEWYESDRLPSLRSIFLQSKTSVLSHCAQLRQTWRGPERGRLQGVSLSVLCFPLHFSFPHQSIQCYFYKLYLLSVPGSDRSFLIEK